MEGVNCPSQGLNNNKKTPSPNTLISVIFMSLQFTVKLPPTPPQYHLELELWVNFDQNFALYTQYNMLKYINI